MSIILYSDTKHDKCLSDRILTRNKFLFIIESAFAQGMFILSTGAFLSAYALSLGANYLAIGLLGALVPLSQVVQLPSTIFVESQLQKRKCIAVIAFTISRSALLISGLLPFVLPKEVIFPIFFILYFIYVIAGNIGGCAFGTWFRDSFAPNVFNQVLTNRFIYATLLGALVSFACAFGIEVIKRDFIELVYYSYSSVFILAGSLGLASAIAMFYIKELSHPCSVTDPSSHNIRILLKPLKDKAYRGLVIFVAIWCVLNNFVGPFLPIFLMKRLSYSLLTVIILTVVNQFANAVAFPFWNRIAKQHGSRVVLLIGIPLFYLSIFLWFPLATITNEYLQWYLILILHITAGIFCAGVNLCLTDLIFSLTPQGKATPYLAFNSSVTGLVSALAPIVGGLVASNNFFISFPLIEKDLNIKQTIIPITGLDMVIFLAGILGIASTITISTLIPYNPQKQRNL